MKNKYWLIAILFLLFILGFGIYFFSRNNNANTVTEYEANKTSSTTDNTNNDTIETQTNSSDFQAPAQTENNTTSTEEEQPTEQEQSQNTTSKTTEDTISTFTTNIYSSDKARQNNIKIACNTLNGTIVKAGETFSFCNTIGKTTSAKGYQEADIFDNDGNKKKGIGGGICQVSSTLYNSILKLDSLTVTERHSHSNKVPYVKSGKDAAVAHRKL